MEARRSTTHARTNSHSRTNTRTRTHTHTRTDRHRSTHARTHSTPLIYTSTTRSQSKTTQGIAAANETHTCTPCACMCARSACMSAHVCVRVRALQGCVRACRRVLPGDEGSTWVRLEHVHQQQHFRLGLAVGRGARRISYPSIQSAIAVSVEVGAEIGNATCQASGTRVAWSA